ncbi:DUF6438 domain-containing protein [Aestuariivivens sediminis]|uniref:DUF6438 domain-containing protein n=1 Tax=Aestuariivivens sediminis TaxID=2913557 RepID=UPI001F5A0595|nr:DUF6438 domain-containing protein [Aestuariivivens sediminis]
MLNRTKVAMTLLTSYFVNKQNRYDDKDDAFLSLTKGKSMNDHPVYDVWLFEDGTVIYKGIENVKKTGIHRTTLSLNLLDKIKALALNLSSKEIGDAKGRDNPLSIIKYNDRKIVYQSARARGNLLELNTLLEHVANSLNDSE